MAILQLPATPPVRPPLVAPTNHIVDRLLTLEATFPLRTIQGQAPAVKILRSCDFWAESYVGGGIRARLSRRVYENAPDSSALVTPTKHVAVCKPPQWTFLRVKTSVPPPLRHLSHATKVERFGH
jgi:hypothetical protein